MPASKKRPVDSEYTPGLPNKDSPHQTPASLLIDVHYAKLLLLERWTWNRFVRFATFLNMTPYELGSVALISHLAVDRLKKNNKIGFGYHGGSAQALILTLLEAHLCKKVSNDVIENPFPNLNIKT